MTPPVRTENDIIGSNTRPVRYPEVFPPDLSMKLTVDS